MQFTSLSSVSPSFTSHSSNNLADIAARVVEEFRNENGYEDYDDIYNFDDDVNHVYAPVDDEPDGNCTESEEESEGSSEFEFDVVRTPHDSSPGAVFFNGEILPRYPLFDRSLLLDDVVTDNLKSDSVSPSVRRPLRTLLIEERESASCSSSEADDLDGVAPETYCIWKPKDESIEKSNSTGNTSKRWKLRNLLHRSNSDVNMGTGKNGSVIVFRNLTVTNKVEKTAKVASEPAVVTDNKMNKEGNRVRSFKHDVAGLFANVNGLSRNLHPF